MLHTFTLVVDNAGDPEPFTVPVACSLITLREIAATTDYDVRAPEKTSAAFRKLAGEALIASKDGINKLQVGQILGYLETVSGSVTFQGICEG
jgi:hypothetical protein